MRWLTVALVTACLMPGCARLSIDCGDDLRLGEPLQPLAALVSPEDVAQRLAEALGLGVLPEPHPERDGASWFGDDWALIVLGQSGHVHFAQVEFRAGPFEKKGDAKTMLDEVLQALDVPSGKTDLHEGFSPWSDTDYVEWTAEYRQQVSGNDLEGAVIFVKGSPEGPATSVLVGELFETPASVGSQTTAQWLALGNARCIDAETEWVPSHVSLAVDSDDRLIWKAALTGEAGRPECTSDRALNLVLDAKTGGLKRWDSDRPCLIA